MFTIVLHSHKLQISLHNYLFWNSDDSVSFCCRRLCPDISFFQIATKHPYKKVTTGECEKLSCCLVKLCSVVQKPVNVQGCP